MPKKRIATIIAVIGKKMTDLELGSTCPFIHYQQALPPSLENKRAQKYITKK